MFAEASPMKVLYRKSTTRHHFHYPESTPISKVVRQHMHRVWHIPKRREDWNVTHNPERQRCCALKNTLPSTDTWANRAQRSPKPKTLNSAVHISRNTNDDSHCILSICYFAAPLMITDGYHKIIFTRGAANVRKNMHLWNWTERNSRRYAIRRSGTSFGCTFRFARAKKMTRGTEGILVIESQIVKSNFNSYQRLEKRV